MANDKEVKPAAKDAVDVAALAKRVAAVEAKLDTLLKAHPGH